MQIDMSQPILNIDGQPFAAQEDGAPMTLGRICANALSAARLEGEDVLRAGRMAFDLYRAAGPVELSAKDVTFVQSQLLKSSFIPPVIWQAHQMLEGNPPGNHTEG